jgi:iron complex outermembrane recepter protein
LLTNPIYASFVKFNPTPTEVAALVNSGLPINAAINQSQVTFIADGRRQNLGTSLMRGIDFSLGYEWEWGGVKLDAGVQGTYLLEYLFQAVPGAAFANVKNTIGFSPRFRSQADFGAKFGGFRARATWNYLNSYDNTSVSPIQKVRRYNTVDLSLGYEFNDNFSVSADVRNLFSQKPPFVDSATGWDAQAASPFPRQFGITASAKF